MDGIADYLDEIQNLNLAVASFDCLYTCVSNYIYGVAYARRLRTAARELQPTAIIYNRFISRRHVSFGDASAGLDTDYSVDGTDQCA